VLESTSFDYVVIRVVPHVERQEFVNVGVILFCRTLNYLDTMMDSELSRLKSLSPDSNVEMIREQLEAISTICSGGAKAGYFGKMAKSERFHWLVSPSSTVIQTSPVHTGITKNPPDTLKELYDLFVA